MKRIKYIFLVALLSFSTNASVLKVFDVLLNGSELRGLMNEQGIYRANVIKEVQKNIRYSLEDLSDRQISSVSQLEKLQRLITDTKDKKSFTEMLSIFKKDKSQVSSEELVESINTLIFISQRYGLKKKSILACAPCVNQELAQAGFKFTLNELDSNQAKKIFKIMSSKAKDPVSSIRFINSQVKRLKIGSRPVVKAHEEEALIYMLLIPRHGSKSEKRLYKALLEVSKNKRGKVDIFDRNNGHKFFNLFSNNLSDNDITFWEELLKDTSKMMKDEDMTTMDAFYRVLERRAQNSADEAEKASLMSKLDYLKREKCFSN
jgi:hypothetical protein